LTCHWYDGIPVQFDTVALITGTFDVPVQTVADVPPPLTEATTVGEMLMVMLMLFDVPEQEPHVAISVYT